MNEIQSVSGISKVLQSRVNSALNDGFGALKGDAPIEGQSATFKANPRIRKSILLSMTMMLNYKATEQVEFGFRNILKHYGPAQSS